MVKAVAMIGLALVAIVPGVACAEPDNVVVIGVPDGGLAAKALMTGDFSNAMRKLQPMRVDGANDPARLINLGHAYAGVGRMEDAREAYRSARFAPDTMLVLANGTEESSRDVAIRALSRLNPNYAMR